MENSMEDPQKIKNGMYDSATLLLGHIPKGNEISILKRYLDSQVHAAFFTTAKIWKQPDY